MSEFRVTGVFPVSVRPNPSVVGDAIGEFEVGGRVELRRADQVVAHGVLEAIEFLCSPRARFALIFSDTISQYIRTDDVIHSLDATDHVIATNGSASRLAAD
ncbi:hypothetical protein ACWZHB_30165 [Nocardia sp. FBN12]|uniref:hypothetical protein n=1 Tax=Nocardia sp. FBN12 TaxID=3419766 RepID=UPI003D052B52